MTAIVVVLAGIAMGAIVLLAFVGVKTPAVTDDVLAAFVGGAIGTVFWLALRRIGASGQVGMPKRDLRNWIVPCLGTLAVAWLSLRGCAPDTWMRLAGAWLVGAVLTLALTYLNLRHSASAGCSVTE